MSSAKAPANQDGGEGELKKGLGNTKSKGVQMSHRWIIDSIEDENLTPAGLTLQRKIQKFERTIALNPKASPPYTRWVIMVTGRQKHLHDTAKKHEIQNPVVTIPDNILAQ